jgi:signal transduction histidine kinase
LRYAGTPRSRDLPVGPDAYDEALRNTDRRVDALREAAMLGSIGAGMGVLWSIADQPFWAGIWALASIVLFAAAGGQVLSTFADRFRRPFLDEELGRVRDRSDAQRAVAGRHAQEMQELTASIAHEIRNPITAAKSLVQQMGEDPDATENLEYANVALEELERVERSVSHLLRFARDEDVALQPLRLAQVVEGALSAIGERAAERGVKLDQDVGAEGAMAGDPEKLRRVILNLVGNAIDALSDARTANPRVEVSLGENLAGSEVWVRVRDNGPGIDPDERRKIFNPFHTGRQSGTGLGLAITKRIVDAHGGEIEAGEAPGGGAEFVLSLPKQTD